jgi:hypothetical protein
VLQSYLDSVTLEAHLVGIYRLERRQLDGGASAYVEARAVAWTFDLSIFELTLIQRATVVRTQIVDGIELPADVTHGDLVISNLKYRYALGWDV